LAAEISELLFQHFQHEAVECTTSNPITQEDAKQQEVEQITSSVLPYTLKSRKNFAAAAKQVFGGHLTLSDSHTAESWGILA